MNKISRRTKYQAPPIVAFPDGPIPLEVALPLHRASLRLIFRAVPPFGLSLVL